MPLKHLFLWQERLVLFILNVWDIGLGNIAKNMTSNMTILDLFMAQNGTEMVRKTIISNILPF